MKVSARILLLIIFTMVPFIIYCQDEVSNLSVDSTSQYKIELYDGTEFIGQIIAKDSTFIVMKTKSLPEVRIPLISISSTTKLNSVNYKAGEYYFENPNPTRYLFGPSAFNLKQGTGYYQNTYVLLNSFNVGVTNYFSIGGGFEILSVFGTGDGGFSPIYIVTPKVGFEVTEKFHAGGGVLYAGFGGLTGDSPNGIGIAYGIGTYGTKDDNITFGLGWGFVGDDFAERPIINIAGMKRVSKYVALVSENWIVPLDDSYYGFYSYGIRFFGKKIAVDLAFINNSDIIEEVFIGIPYVDFVVTF